MATGLNTEELLKKLDEQHQAYLKTFRLVYEALAHTAAEKAAPASSGLAIIPTKRRRRSTLDASSERSADHKPATYHSSVLTGESDESEDEPELYVQEPLPSYQYDHEDLRHHLKKYQFQQSGKLLLDSVVDNGRLLDPGLFPEYPPEENWHNSHYSVFDVGNDGAPVSRHKAGTDGTLSIDAHIWLAIQVMFTLRLDEFYLTFVGFERQSY